MHKIFISYSRADYSTVIKLKEEIESRTGHGSCWIDMSGIESDSQFVDTIINAIDQADIFLFMYSAHSERSEWTRKEIEYAHSEKKRIVFANIDSTPLSKYFKFQFGGHDIIDMRDKLQRKKLLDNLTCWCCSSAALMDSSSIDDGKASEEGSRSAGSAVSRFIEKARNSVIIQKAEHAVKYALYIFAKTLLYLYALASLIYFTISCTDGYDSDMEFFAGLMFAFSLIAWLFVHFKLIRITFRYKMEKAILFIIPLLLNLCSLIIYRCESTEAESIDMTAEKQIPPNEEKEVSEKDTADTKPTFPGGMNALQQALANNIVYPAIAQETGIQGKVIVRFKVNADGTISDISIEKSLSKECDQAAIDAVRKLQRFSPAQKEGRPVSAWLHLPVTFRLE